MANLPGGGRGDVLPVADPPDAVKKLFFADDYGSERCETLMQYVKPNETAMPVMEIPVPGDERTYLKRSNRVRNRVRRGTCALVAWFCQLHDAGYFLDGKFTVEDFGIDQLGNLRGKMSLLVFLKKFTVEGIVVNDMVVVAGIIRTDLHSGLQIPPDLTHLLKQLAKHKTSCSPLIMNHASHDEEDVKSALFFKMFNRLKALEISDPATYGRIIQQLGMIPDVKVWLDSAMANFHLHAVLRHKPWNPNTPKTLRNVLIAIVEARVRYPGDAVGLLDFRRNGHAHLETDYSVDTIGHLEAGLFGTLEGLRMCNQQTAAPAAPAAAPPPPVAAPPPAPAAPPPAAVPALQLPLLPIYSRSSWIALIVANFLVGAQLSLAAARAGARAAALHLVTANTFHLVAESQAALVAAASAAATQGGAAHAGPPPSIMFDAKDIDHMFDILAPNLLVGFQKIMFMEGECFRLGDDTKVPKLID